MPTSSCSRISFSFSRCYASESRMLQSSASLAARRNCSSTKGRAGLQLFPRELSVLTETHYDTQTPVQSPTTAPSLEIHRESKDTPVFHQPQLGKTLSSSQYTSEIFSPEIIKIGQYLTKLQLIIDGGWYFFDSRCTSESYKEAMRKVKLNCHAHQWGAHCSSPFTRLLGGYTTGRLVTENDAATDISPLCPTIQSGSLRFRSFKYF